jgi:hypothetical protein
VEKCKIVTFGRVARDNVQNGKIYHQQAVGVITSDRVMLKMIRSYYLCPNQSGHAMDLDGLLDLSRLMPGSEPD